MNFKKYQQEHPERLHAFDAETKSISARQKLHERLTRSGMEAKKRVSEMIKRNGGTKSATE